MALSQRPYGPSNGQPSGLNSISANTVEVNASPFPSTVVGLVTTEQVIPNAALTPSTALIAAIPSKSGLEQILFKIQASGRCAVNATTTTLTIKLYSGISLTVGSDTLLKSSGAITPTDTSFPWFLEGNGIYDSTSGKFHGTVKFVIDNQIVSEAVFTNAVSSVNDSNNSVISLVLSATFSAASASNVFYTQAFSIG